MKFNEAVQAMLDGKKVTRLNSTGYGYIMINDNDEVVGNTGSPFSFSKKDFVADWETVDIPSAGALLARYGKSYRLIKDTDGTYAVLDEETYVEEVKGINEENLVHDLMCYDFDIVR